MAIPFPVVRITDKPFATSGVSAVVGLSGSGSVVQTNGKSFNVMDFGAVADYGNGNTDNTVAFQTAMNKARSTGGTVFIPAGSYYFAGTSSLDPGAGGFSMVGEYGKSMLYWNPGTYKFTANPGGTQNHLIRNTANVAKQLLYFENLTVVGDFDTRGENGGGTAFYLDHYPEIKFSYCKWKRCAWMATDIHFSQYVSWDYCLMEECARDGCRSIETKYVSVTNCTFRTQGDDCVAFHGNGYSPGYDPDDGTPRREGLIVSGCKFLDCTSSITALGCRSVIVTSNYSNRLRGAFFFGPNDPQSTGEGSNPCHTLLIADNVILNSVGGLVTAQAMINITGIADPRATAQSSGIVPGMPNGSGVFTPVWGWDNADIRDANDAIPPPQDWVIRGNIIARRLPAVAHYSDWGFGKLGSHDWNYDPAIVDDAGGVAGTMRCNGISIEAGLRTLVEGNVISHVGIGIALFAPSTLKPQMTAAVVRGNTLFDVTNACINIGTTGFNDIVVERNILYGDVYRLAANSNANGTYNNGSLGPYGILNLGTGAVVKGNKIGFVCIPVSNLNSGNITEDNLVVATVAAGGGFSVSNKGVGTIWDEDQFGFTYLHVNCDPTSGTYGTLLNVEVNYSSTMPSTGTYVRGHIVRRTTPTITSKGLLYGWYRLVTGSSHTLNTDWAPMYFRTDIGIVGLTDGITAPSAVVGSAQIYVDSADGDLKIIFGDGVVKTIVVDS